MSTPALSSADDPNLALQVNGPQVVNGAYEYTVTINSIGYCDPSDVTTYPTVSWSTDDTEDTSDGDPNYTPLANAVDGSTAPGCVTSWQTDNQFGDTSYGLTPAGEYYFQGAINCDTVNDPFCEWGQYTTPLVGPVAVSAAPGSGYDGGDSEASAASGRASRSRTVSTTSSGADAQTQTSGSAPPASPCRGKTGLAAKSCRLGVRYRSALVACDRKTGSKRTNCRKVANVSYHRRLALLKCERENGRKLVACIAKAREIKP